MKQQISNDLIRQMQQHVSVSYEDAQYYLKKTNGNVELAVERVIRRRNHWMYKLTDAIKRFFLLFHDYRLMVNKNERSYLDVPIVVMIIYAMIIGIDRSIMVAIVTFLILLLGGVELQLKRRMVKSNSETTDLVQTAEVNQQAPVADYQQTSSPNDYRPSKDDYELEKHQQQTSPSAPLPEEVVLTKSKSMAEQKEETVVYDEFVVE